MGLLPEIDMFMWVYAENYGKKIFFSMKWIKINLSYHKQILQKANMRVL